MTKLEKFAQYNGVEICGYNGSLTDLGKSDGINAIINAANTALCLGWGTKRLSEFALGWSVGGVANAIRKTAGRKVMNECRKIVKERGSWLNPGETVCTSGGNLDVDYIIHAASTTFLGSNQEIIRKCVKNSLSVAYNLGLEGIAFPILGGGAGRMRVEDISTYMREEFQRYLIGQNLNKIVIAVPSTRNYEKSRQVFMG